jgi:drug/metabolite transporter (DMT)-like permease
MVAYDLGQHVATNTGVVLQLVKDEKKTNEIQMKPQKISESHQTVDNNHDVSHDTDIAGVEENRGNSTITKWVAIMFLFITINGWGSSAVFAILAFRRNETSLIQNLSTLVVGKYFGLLFFVRIPTTGVKGIIPTIPEKKSWVVFFATVIPSFSAVAYVLFGIAVQIDSGASSIQTMCQLHSIFPIVFGIFVLKEKISTSKALGIVIMLSGCALLGITGESSEELSFAGLMLTTVCIFLWGSTYTTNIIFCKYYSSKQFNEAIYFGVSTLAVSWCVIASIIENQNAKKERRSFYFQNIFTLNFATMFLFLSQLTNETVSCLYTQVGKVFDASILSPITMLYNLYPILFCIVYYQETVTPYKVIGCTFTMLGAMYLGIVTNSKKETDSKTSMNEAEEELEGPIIEIVV